MSGGQNARTAKSIIIIYLVLASSLKSEASYKKGSKLSSLWTSGRHADVRDNDTTVDKLKIEYLAESRGFSMEAHQVVTRDDYLLTIHRLKNPLVNATEPRNVVIIQHGILCASSFFLLNSSPRQDRPTLGCNNNNATTITTTTTTTTVNTTKADVAKHAKCRTRTSNSLAFALANLGYDVWLTNFRGTEHARKRVNLTRDAFTDEAFWDYNVDTLIEYDHEAYVNYVLAKTHAKRYTFVGHSLGATVGLGSLLVHKKSPVTSRLACSVLMAPVASTRFIHGSLIPLFRTATMLYSDLAAFPGASKTFSSFSHHLCLIAQRACTWLASMFIGAKQKDKLPRDSIGDTEPSYRRSWSRLLGSLRRSNRTSKALNDQSGGVDMLDRNEYQKQVDVFVLMMRQAISVKVLEHIVQVHDSGRLSRFNYGPELNKSKYGTRLAPAYDLSEIAAPKLKIALVSGLSDAISTPEEIKWITKQLKSRVGHLEHIQVPIEPFNHMDLIMSRDAGELVNKQVISFIEQNKCFNYYRSTNYLH